MPEVDGKRYPYSPEGIKAANEAKSEKGEMESLFGSGVPREKATDAGLDYWSQNQRPVDPSSNVYGQADFTQLTGQYDVDSGVGAVTDRNVDEGMYDYAKTHVASNVDSSIANQQIHDVDQNLEHWTKQKIDVEQNLDFWLKQSESYGRPSKFIDDNLKFWNEQAIEVDKNLNYFSSPPKDMLDQPHYDVDPKMDIYGKADFRQVNTQGGGTQERSIMNWMNNNRWSMDK